MTDNDLIKERMERFCDACQTKQFMTVVKGSETVRHREIPDSYGDIRIEVSALYQCDNCGMQHRLADQYHCVLSKSEFSVTADALIAKIGDIEGQFGSAMESVRHNFMYGSPSRIAAELNAIKDLRSEIICVKTGLVGKFRTPGNCIYRRADGKCGYLDDINDCKGLCSRFIDAETGRDIDAMTELIIESRKNKDKDKDKDDNKDNDSINKEE